MARMIRMNMRAIMFYNIIDIRTAIVAATEYGHIRTNGNRHQTAKAAVRTCGKYQLWEPADFLIACPRLFAGTGASFSPAGRADGHSPSAGLLQ